MNPWWICVLLCTLLVIQHLRAHNRYKRIRTVIHTIAVGKERPSFIRFGPKSLREAVADLELIQETLYDNQRRLSLEDFNLRGILSSMIEAVFVTNASGHIILANDQLVKMFGLEKPPLYQTVLEALGNHQINHALREVLRNHSQGRWQLTIRSPEPSANRRPLHAMLTISAVVNTNKELLGAVGVLHDITAIKQMELAQKEFVSNTSHELRTPLAIFRGYIEELIEAPPASRKELVRILKLIQAQTDRLHNLIQDLLTLSQFEMRKITLRKESVNLSAIIEETISELGKTEALRGWHITLKSRIPREADCCWMDVTRIKQVLCNLIENAVKYSPEHREILITIDPVEGQDYLKCSITDYGIGIAKDDLPYVFERFFRADRGRARSTGGTGLGLSIVKQIIEAHGGQVGITSQLGEGTTIFFTLPKSDCVLGGRNDASPVPSRHEQE